MQFFLLGLAALLLSLLVLRGFSMANPHVLVGQLRMGAGIAALVGASFLVLRGLVGYAVSLAALGSWLLWGQGAAPWGSAGSAQRSPGQTSRVATEHLEVELDHDTGEMRGRVLKGSFAGRTLEELSPLELAQLWRDCRFADPQSTRILEAYLDRAHPSWREDLARQDGETGARRAGKMSRAEALDILGLPADASDEDVRRAHRELMLKLHPDRGGSTRLAAQINEAKDVLLGK
jgi:DnaJ-like protein